MEDVLGEDVCPYFVLKLRICGVYLKYISRYFLFSLIETKHILSIIPLNSTKFSANVLCIKLSDSCFAIIIANMTEQLAISEGC